jgi:MFS family permease
MVADASKIGQSGRDFGITRFLDTLGALTGILVVLALGVGRGPMSQAVFRACGWIVYAAAYVVMGLSRTPTPFALALLGYGAFYGLTEGVEKALLADLVLPEHRGTGFGALQTVLGLAALIASPLMGLMMTLLSPRTAFLISGGTALMATVALVTWRAMRKAV